MKLMERFKSMKHYFFLDKGDFFVHFFDFSEDMLELSSKVVPIEKMNSLL
jgi:gamma-tubulin complex component 2